VIGAGFSQSARSGRPPAQGRLAGSLFMKKLMMLGGLLGFSTGLVIGLACGASWPSVMWRASVAALGAGWLVRWWGGVWVRSLREGFAENLSVEPARASSDSLKR
jgi:hypothetical protein